MKESDPTGGTHASGARTSVLIALIILLAILVPVGLYYISTLSFSNGTKGTELAAPDTGVKPVAAPAPNRPAPASPPADWQPRFAQIYRLDPGQFIKFIPEPFIAQRRGYWQARLARIAAARGTTPPVSFQAPSAMVFILRDTEQGNAGELQVQTNSGLFIPTSAPGLAGVLKDLGLANAPSALLKPEIGPQFSNIALRGDWILRDDTRGRWLVRNTPVPDAVWRDLAQILKDRTGRTIRFEKRTIDRECVVVQGRLAFVPLDNQHNDAVYVPLGVAGNSTVAAFLHALSISTGCPFVDQTQSSSEHLRWKVLPAAPQPVVFHLASSTAPAGDNLPVDTVAPMLADLARQTSLEFRKEKRPVEVVVAIEAP